VSTDEVPRLELALPLDRDRPAGFALELVCQQIVCRARDLDPARGPVGFHAAGRVHRVAPEVVEEALPSDYARNDRA
jgi:hypothetical protein